MADQLPYRIEDAAQLNRQVGPRPDTGYAVNIPNVDPNDQNNWTIRLIKPNRKYLNLWVEDMSIDFSIAGSAGQSRWKREFFPHSFNQPVLSMMGYMPNPQEYNKLAAFVRESHSEALNINRNYSETSGTNTNTYKNSSIPLPTVTLISNPRRTFGRSRNQKGGRRGMKLEGYIGSISAGVVRHEQAPQFKIDFIIAASDGTVGIYDDRLDSGSQITDWMRLFQKDFLGAQRGDQIRQAIEDEQLQAAAEEDAANTNARLNQMNSGSNPTDLPSFPEGVDPVNYLNFANNWNKASSSNVFNLGGIDQNNLLR